MIATLLDAKPSKDGSWNYPDRIYRAKRERPLLIVHLLLKGADLLLQTVELVLIVLQIGLRLSAGLSRGSRVDGDVWR